ncbi:MAG: hypothetical protein Q6K80_11150 [Thermostichus sp. DG_1_6_bins_120]
MWRDMIGLALAATLLLISKTTADTIGREQTQVPPEPLPYAFPVE